VLADEPTGNLDTKTSESVISALTALNNEGVTVVVITHDREVANQFPRQIGVRDGQIETDSARGRIALSSTETQSDRTSQVDSIERILL